LAPALLSARACLLGAVLAAGAIAPGAHAQYKPTSPWDAAVRELRKATTAAANGSHHPRLVALRQLRDPALKPLFQSLVQGSHWTMQIDGILGLAELDAKGVVDPFLLGQLKGDNDRSTAIGAACGLDLVGIEQANAMLAWNDLPARDRVLLLAELHRHGGQPDVERIRALSDDRNDEVSGVATFLLATVTKETAPVDRFRTRFGALHPRERAAIVASLAEAAARFKLNGAAGFLDGAIQDATLATEAKLAAISALLQIEPDVGYAQWKKAVEADPSQANRVRLGLVALGAPTVLPKEGGLPLRQLPAGETLEPLLAKIADAIDAIGGTGELVKTFPALVKTKHRATLSAALERVKTLDADTKRATYEACADLITVEERSSVPAAVGQIAVDAVGQLGELDASAVAKRLEQATSDNPAEARTPDTRQSDTRTQELLLLALLQSNTKEAAAAAMEYRSKVSRRGAAMALLLHARFAEKLNREEIDELGVIASGGWTLDPGLEIQAAWLYARHSGRADEAIATILKPAPSGTTP
jgi:hypothetical protein